MNNKFILYYKMQVGTHDVDRNTYKQTKISSKFKTIGDSTILKSSKFIGNKNGNTV